MWMGATPGRRCASVFLLSQRNFGIDWWTGLNEEKNIKNWSLHWKLGDINMKRPRSNWAVPLPSQLMKLRFWIFFMHILYPNFDRKCFLRFKSIFVLNNTSLPFFFKKNKKKFYNNFQIEYTYLLFSYVISYFRPIISIYFRIVKCGL